MQTATTPESSWVAPQVEPGISRSQHRVFAGFKPLKVSVTVKKLIEDGLLHG